MKWLLLSYLIAFSAQADLLNDIDDTKLLLHIERLSSEPFSGRATQTLGNRLSQDYIIAQLKNSGVTPFKSSFRQVFSFIRHGQHVNGTNIIGQHLGNPNSNIKWIVLTAHYDHLGKGNAGVYCGTDDNASGVSALLSIAALIKYKNLKANFLFLFTDAEELGLHGSKAFVSAFPTVLQQTVLNINIDMIGGSANTNRLFMLSRGLNRVLTKQALERFHQIDKQMGLKVYTRFRNTLAGNNKSIRWLRASDHGPFYKNQIPILFFSSGVHENYHTVNDTFENINKDFFVKNTRVIAEHIVYLINAFNKNLTI